MSSLNTVISIFQSNLSRFDLDNNGIMSSQELNIYGDDLREGGFFKNLDVDENAFMLEVHHYDNQMLDTVRDGIEYTLQDEKNYMGTDIFSENKKSPLSKTGMSLDVAMSLFQGNLEKFDLNRDGIMSTGEVNAYGQDLKQYGFFENMGINQNAFMLELHRYDNQTLGVIAENMEKSLEDTKNYIGMDIFAENQDIPNNTFINDTMTIPSLNTPQIDYIKLLADAYQTLSNIATHNYGVTLTATPQTTSNINIPNYDAILLNAPPATVNQSVPSYNDMITQFEKYLPIFDLNNNGIMSAKELDDYGNALKRNGFFSKMGLNESAFMLELHRYDNQTIDLVKLGIAEGVKDRTNYLGTDVLLDNVTILPDK